MIQLIQWFSMNGYAMCIWPAYGVVCFVLIGNLLNIKWQCMSTRRKLQQWFNRQ